MSGPNSMLAQLTGTVSWCLKTYATSTASLLSLVGSFTKTKPSLSVYLLSNMQGTYSYIKSSTAVSPVSLLCPLSRHLLINTHSLQCMLSHHPLIILQSLQMLCSSQCLLSTVHSLQTLHSSHSSSKSL